MRIARVLTNVLVLIMLAQAVTGRLFEREYRDVELINATWIGNDWITLLVAVPLLVAGSAGAARGSTRSLLIWLGMLGYAVYNYAFYLFGAALNAFFPLYVLAVVTSAVALIVALAAVDTSGIARTFRQQTPVRAIGGYLVLVGFGLACVWTALWAAHVFGGRPTPLDPEAFKLVAALDLSLMVPALTVGGVLLSRRVAAGYVIAAIATIQGALYLTVLSASSIVAVQRGLVAAPGELPIWATLATFTTAAALILLANVRESRSQDA